MEVTVAKKCPNCNYVLRVKKPSVCKTSEDPTIKQKIKDGSFFEYKCPHCGETIILVFPFVYIDEEKSLLIQVFASEESSEAFTEGLRDNEGKFKNYRIVFDFLGLSEKVDIFDHEKDDRVIELVKGHYKILIQEKHPDFIPVRIFYFSNPNDPSIDGFCFIDNEHNKLFYRISVLDYNIYFLKFYPILEEEYKDKMWFDAYADDFMYNHIEEMNKASVNFKTKLVSTDKIFTSAIFRCSKCGAKASVEDLRCRKCGYRIGAEYKKKYCKYCGQAIEAGDKFCKKCGKAQ